jgi:KTSC domain
MPSSVIARFHYDADRERLTVTFVTGRVYEYMNVPSDVATNFGIAYSKGIFFNTHIRDRFDFRETTPTRGRPAYAGPRPTTLPRRLAHSSVRR